jgi:hypothetical protein
LYAVLLLLLVSEETIRKVIHEEMRTGLLNLILF